MDKNEELKSIVEKRMKTVFIGAISSIEDSAYGKLKSESPEWNRIFQDLRNDILNKGNDQLRILLEELDDFSVGARKYKYYMPTFGSREEIEAYKRGQRDSNRR